MLLGGARYLAAARSFDGTVHFIFQPAEETSMGAKSMIEAGLFNRFPAEAVYGMHNAPGLPVGKFTVRSGPVMAGEDSFTVTLRGRGGHGGMPHTALDSVVAASELVLAWQTIVSRINNPQRAMVVTVAEFHAGSKC